MSMSKEHLRTGDKAIVRFRFIKNPEYLRSDMRMVFREGRTKAVGTVTTLFPHVSLTAQNTRQQRASKKAVESNHQLRPQNEPQKPSKKNRRARNHPYPPTGGATGTIGSSCSATALGGATSSNATAESNSAAAQS
ncbi:hypothetical protein LSH36_891g02043 [Paralvinella palmiformis]|uniref:Uncharacterized protein n=1 Tax=Paralvinella palmiformis TaxID=53620 RepID=A0AAD9MSX8_9ANNE|nr:hypothetical protein LSH36_891g02043 [Paralvinella palmiformis]